MKIAIGADHAAYNEKKQIINYLNSKGFEIIDLGSNSKNC